MKPKLNPSYMEAYFQYIQSESPSDFYVITAYNPDGKTVSIADNSQADIELCEAIEALKLKSFSVIGMSQDELHAEPGWGVHCDEKIAIELAKRFRQEAIFHFTDGQIHLVDCKTGKRFSLRNPSERIRDPQKLHHFTLFVGSHKIRKKIDPLEYAGVCVRVGAASSRFTIQRAEGCNQAQFEDNLIIHISTYHPIKAIELAHNLRCFLNQDSIGISHNGIYHHVREWSDSAFILKTFSLDH